MSRHWRNDSATPPTPNSSSSTPTTSGSCHSANVGVFECLATGVVTSATLMVPCPWAREASSRYRGEDIGVHLTLNAEFELYRWGPITHAPSLLGGDGGFPRTMEDVWDHADLDEVRRECRAQIERAILWGFDVSHLDAHMGTLQLRPEFFDVYLDMAIEFGLPLRMIGAGMERYVGFPGRAVAAEAGAVFTDHMPLRPRGGLAPDLREGSRLPAPRRDRDAPAPGRRQRRAALAGHRRLGGPGGRPPHHLRRRPGSARPSMPPGPRSSAIRPLRELARSGAEARHAARRDACGAAADVACTLVLLALRVVRLLATTVALVLSSERRRDPSRLPRARCSWSGGAGHGALSPPATAHAGKQVVLDAPQRSRPTRLCARRNWSTGWISSSTSGGRPNQKGELGSTWVACAFSARPRTSVAQHVDGGRVRVVAGQARQPLLVEGDSIPSSTNLAWI